MQWRLGLDLGTNSIGWSVVGLNGDNKPADLLDLGVRIFSDGRDQKTHEPLAVARRTARGIRKNIRRRKTRRKELFRQLQKDSLFPAEKIDAEKIKELNPYELRVKSLDEKLSAVELGRVLFHLGVRRGFKSNRKDTADESVSNDSSSSSEKKELIAEKMKQGEKCVHLEQTIADSGCRTLGEFLWKNLQKNEKKGVRFVPERSIYYPLRQLYENEFTLIRQKQEQYHSINWDEIHRIIFFQRPLKPQERGKCQFMSSNERTFKAMPSSQQFRILQEIYNLSYTDSQKRWIALTVEQEDLLVSQLNTCSELSFDKIRKILKIDADFNLESEARTKLNGNSTACKLRNEKLFGALWDELPLAEQDDIVETLITADEDADVLRVLERYVLTDEQKSTIIRAVFVSGTTSLCKEVTQKLVAHMRDKHFKYDKALILLGFDHSEQTVKQSDSLPYYGKILTGSTIGAGKSPDENKPELKYGKIGNPTVHVALNQTRVVVNALIKQYGKPTQISLELSRELKASREDRQKTLKKQAENAKQNQIYNKSITDLSPAIKYPGRMERLKFKLWQELGSDSMSRRCLYCGQTIGAHEIFSSNIEIEHILPYSRTLLDAESNLTVAHKHCNAKKKEFSPFEAFGASPSGYDWHKILERVAAIKNPVKRARFSPDAMLQFEKDSVFIARQLTDNAYLSRISLRYLKAVCSDIWAVNGTMTKIMRDKWQIDEILKRKITEKEIAAFNLNNEKIGQYKKNRFDHRHHALDALVIALTDRSMVQHIATKSAHSFTRNIMIDPLPFLRSDVLQKIQNIVVSFKPDHGKEGKLSKETFLGLIKKEEIVSIKDLTLDDIEFIKSDRVRNDFEELTAERGNFKKAVRELQETYPQVKIFRRYFVSRSPISSLKTEKKIDNIVDITIRKRLKEYITSHPGEKIEKIVAAFSSETGIRRVRCTTFVQSPIIIEPDTVNPKTVRRYLNPEDYFAAIIWEIPAAKIGKPAKYEAQYIRRTEFDKAGNPLEQKPHPAAKKICQLHKNDYIEFSEDGVWKKARIAGYSATNNLLDVRPIFAANDTESWIIATNEQMLEKGWKAISGQYYVSVNVLFGEKSARKITVSPIGKVRRKRE